MSGARTITGTGAHCSRAQADLKSEARSVVVFGWWVKPGTRVVAAARRSSLAERAPIEGDPPVYVGSLFHRPLETLRCGARAERVVKPPSKPVLNRRELGEIAFMGRWRMTEPIAKSPRKMCIVMKAAGIGDLADRPTRAQPLSAK